MNVLRRILSHLGFFSDLIMYLIAVALLSIFPAIHGLSCIGLDIPVFTRIDSYNRSILKEVLDRVNLILNQDQCRVEIWVSHAEQKIQMRFTKILKSSILPVGVGKVYFITIMRSDDKGNVELLHILTNACSKSDTCEKQFLLDHVDWLVKSNYTDFLEKGSTLLVGPSGSSGEWHDC